jgi:uncharacterized protein (DUF1697 family)
MKTYITLLRGINVSGQKLIKMNALRASFESLGFEKVQSYLQSGNVIFQGDDRSEGTLEQRIAQQINSDFGFEVPVLVLSVDKLEAIIKNNPFLNDLQKNISQLHICFLAAPPIDFHKVAIESKVQTGEAISFSEEAIYLYCPNGYGKTKLNNNFLESKLKVTATTRNLKTSNELLNIAKSIHTS